MSVLRCRYLMKPKDTNQLYINCIGGLGNQMFMYAAGRYFARTLNRTLEIVKPVARSQESLGYKRPFQLDVFCFEETLRETRFLDRIFFSENPRLSKPAAKIAHLLGAEILREPATYHFHQEVESDPSCRSSYLCGYWQASGTQRPCIWISDDGFSYPLRCSREISSMPTR